MTTTPAPNCWMTRALSRNAASPSFKLIELTMALPCTHSSPASSTDHLLLSIMMGMRATSGSVASRFRKVRMQPSESSRPSSMLTSSTLAPARTCWTATSRALVMSPFLIILRKRRDPVTLVRSPTTMNVVSGRISRGSRPLNCEKLGASTCGRGDTPSTAFAIARMWSGVVPQQPPTRLTKPSLAKPPTSAAVCSGVSSYSPKALGSPAFG